MPVWVCVCVCVCGYVCLVVYNCRMLFVNRWWPQQKLLISTNFPPTVSTRRAAYTIAISPVVCVANRHIIVRDGPKGAGKEVRGQKQKKSTHTHTHTRTHRVIIIQPMITWRKSVDSDEKHACIFYRHCPANSYVPVANGVVARTTLHFTVRICVFERMCVCAIIDTHTHHPSSSRTARPPTLACVANRNRVQCALNVWVCVRCHWFRSISIIAPRTILRWWWWWWRRKESGNWYRNLLLHSIAHIHAHIHTHTLRGRDRQCEH